VKRVVDLRVLIAIVVVLGAALAVTSIELVNVYNSPVQHVAYFQGSVTAKVVNYSTIVGEHNYSLTGVPAGALLGFNWDNAGPGGMAGVIAYEGPNPNGFNAQVCVEAPQVYDTGSCTWTANGQTLTVIISDWTSVAPFTPANFTGEVTVQGWYAYTTPAI